MCFTDIIPRKIKAKEYLKLLKKEEEEEAWGDLIYACVDLTDFVFTNDCKMIIFIPLYKL